MFSNLLTKKDFIELIMKIEFKMINHLTILYNFIGLQKNVKYYNYVWLLCCYFNLANKIKIKCRSFKKKVNELSEEFNIKVNRANYLNFPASS